MSAERVVIVGGGVLGTMHSLQALRRGWEVVHLETDAAPRRASVRNFGLVWVSGRAAGEELELALRARQLWGEIAESTPAVQLRPAGSVTVAADHAELSVMSEAAVQSDAERRGFEQLDASAVREVNPAIRGDIAGGLWCRNDAVVEPGSVLGAIRETMEKTGRYQWIPGRQVIEVRGSEAGNAHSEAAPEVIDHTGTIHRASLVLLCIGDRLSGLGGKIGAELATAPLRRCRLQMMQTAPAPERVTTAIADGDSMRYYPAFDLPGRASLPAPRPETDRWAMQLLLVQRSNGELTIGDTHIYDEPFDFAVDERAYDHLRARAESILGWPLPPVARRWAGVYTLATDGGICFRRRIEPNVWVVTAPAGRGMTLSPAIAEQTWQEVNK
jgi:FAD dependent oxidoreductase TIGR03364